MRIARATITGLTIGLVILVSNGCGESSSSSSSSSSSPNGTYTYTESGGVENTITVNGTSWVGTMKLCDYCDKSYESGTVKGNNLFDSSGMVKIGSISGSSLSTSLGGSSVTLRK